MFFNLFDCVVFKIDNITHIGVIVHIHSNKYCEVEPIDDTINLTYCFDFSDLKLLINS